MSINYQKLTEDLINARIAAEEAERGDDGGSANLDTLTIKIPRAREDKVIEAAQKAGLHVSKQEWLGPRFFVYPPKCGQGNSRVRATKAMKKVLVEAGYRCLMYERID